MEQVPRKGAKTDKNSESRQKRDDGRLRRGARDVARWSRATWSGRAPASTRSLTRFSI